MIVGLDQKFWPRVARALGLDDLIDDPRFARGFPRWTNREELEKYMEPAFARLTSEQALTRLREEDVPASLVQDYALLARQEQPWANGYLVEREHPKFGKQRLVGMHIHLSETPGEAGSAAPELGADTDEVLGAIGATAATPA